MYSPQKIVFQLLGGRLFERGNSGTLGVHCANYVPHRAIFAAGVHGLQHNQQGAPGLGV